MRTIGSLETELAAKRFGDLLYVEGIETQIDPEEDGTFSIWILDDERRARSAELLEQFRANPESAEFAKVATRAQQQRGRDARLESGRRSVVADAARIGYEREFQGVAFLPLILLLLCLASAIYSNAGSDRPALAPLLISNYERAPVANEWVHIKSGKPGGFLAEVRDGQVWRLLTPAFIHFGWLHLLFNAFWLRDFGTFLENRLGFAHVLLFVIVAALVSNVAEFAWSGHPYFGGMSGVVYGLFGLIWIRGKFDRHNAWPLNKTTVQVLLIWYVLCLTGLFQAVANVAHTAGLLVGMAWGYLSARK